MKQKRHKHSLQFICYDEGSPVWWCSDCGAIRMRWYGRWVVRNHTDSWRVPGAAKRVSR